MKDINLLIWLTQLGISVVAPLGGFVWLGVWLRQRFELGVWVVLLGILVGVVCAVSSAPLASPVVTTGAVHGLCALVRLAFLLSVLYCLFKSHYFELQITCSFVCPP